MTELEVGQDVVVRVLAACLLGGLIGLEREIDDQPAGLRTHLSVALGACLFGLVSTLGFSEFVETGGGTNLRVDPTRVAAQVAPGIGFLGAGVIFRHGANVRNLTTAASLWVTAAVGLTAGVGDLGTAGVATAALLVALAALRLPRDRVRVRFTRREREARLGLRSGTNPQGAIDRLQAIPGAAVSVTAMEKIDGQTQVRLRIRTEPGHQPEMVLAELLDHPDVEVLTFADEA